MADETTRLLGAAPTREPDEGTDPTKLSQRARNIVLGAVWVGVFLGALDTTIVATLVSSISSSFNSSNQSSWLGTSYLLSTATFTPIYGRLSDIVGRRGAVLTALTFFTVGTTICGIAPSMLVLIIGRLIAGMGGGGLMAVSSIIASDLIPLKQRGLFQGIANCFFGLGAGLGGPVGGVLADWIGWRAAFLIQLPILAVSFTLIISFVHYTVPGQGKSKREMIRRIDYMGSISLVLSLGSLLFALSYKNNDAMSWSSPFVYGPLIVCAVSSIAFVLVEAYFAPEPVMPLRILFTRNGCFVAWTNFFMSMVSFSVLYFLPMWFEVVTLRSVTSSGAHLLPNSVALSCGSLFAGWWMRRTGKYYWLTVTSALLPVVALVLLALMDEHSSPVYQWLAVVPSGFGFSSVVTSILIAMIASVERADVATATGITYLFRYVGQLVGVSLSAALLQSVLTSQLHQRITGPGSIEIIEKICHASSSVPGLPTELRRAAIASYAIGLRYVFIMNAVLAFVTFLCTLPIREYLLPGSFEEEEAVRKQREDDAMAQT